MCAVQIQPQEKPAQIWDHHLCCYDFVERPLAVALVLSPF